MAKQETVIPVQMVRLVLEDFLDRDTAEQQELIVRRLFGRSKG